ncbi:hypothetical protein D9601_12185 [Sphingomonas sp. MA1305]|uniref:hypothetical protein n=1 Tax=Sphingomonas sp. MA1305 TaxID=2479204 RepID=UPI0018E0086E|nr:hypothetical protein [Sphingomonas sp. MA1305]MBI0476109.1 hypothetical protein [Sphingomonas sp. MA1305]
MVLTISSQNTEAGDISMIDNAGRSAVLAITAPVKANTAIGPQTIAFGEAVAGFSRDAMTQAGRLLPEALNAHLLSTASAVLAGPFRAVQAAAIKEDQARRAAEARLLETPNDTASVAIRAEHRGVLRTLDHATLPTAINSADLLRLQAILELPDGFPSQFVDMARDRAMRLAHIQKSGLQADYALKPDANDPLAHGPDAAAAERAADAALATHRQRSETIDLTRNMLREAIHFVAVAGGVDQDRAFAALTGAAA